MGVWASFARLLGVSWVLGTSGQPPGRLLRSLLGGFWAVLGTKLGRLGGSGNNLEASLSDFRTKMELSWYQDLLNHESYVKIFLKLKTSIFLL